MDIFISHDGYEVDIPNGILNNSVNEKLSKEMLIVAQLLPDDPSKINEDDLYSFCLIATKYKLGKALNLAFNEINERKT